MKNNAARSANPSRIATALVFKRSFDLVAVVTELVSEGRYRHEAAARRHLTMKLGCEKLARKLAKRSIRRGARMEITNALAELEAEQRDADAAATLEAMELRDMYADERDADDWKRYATPEAADAAWMEDMADAAEMFEMEMESRGPLS